jgi:hypothetical protein
MHLRAVGRASEQLFECDQPMAAIQVEDAEDLVGSVAQLRHQEPARHVWRRQ